VAFAAGLILLVFGLLPIANWIPGGHEAPWYAARLADWVNGTGIVVGIGIIAAIVFRRWPESPLWRSGLWSGTAGRWRRGGRKVDIVIALAVFAVCAIVAQTVLSAKPLLIDEIIQLYQARILAAGHLWLPAPAHPEFRSVMHLIDWGGKIYGQFPVGGPVMLAIGTIVHAEWLVGPAATAIGAYLFARVLRLLDLSDGAALAALLLYGFAPFTDFLGGSMMNHVTETTWLLAATLALLLAVRDSVARPAMALAMGLCFGVAATIRPTDAAAFAIPSAIWLLWRSRLGSRQIVALIASGVGVAIPMVLMLMVNHEQTGHALRFGYIEMWGKSHDLGFHAAPWGPAHTPARGLELVNLYLLRLQDYLFESPAPSLLFATMALLLTRTRAAVDRWILTSCGLILLAYFAYWHDGFYLGPRFVLPLAPWLALWTARLPSVMRERRWSMPVMRGMLVAGVVSLLIGACVSVPIRARQYRNGMLSMRLDIPAAIKAAGVHDAIVLVRESWGAQLMARMWGLGVSRTAADQVYRTTDACQLQLAILATEHDNGNAAELQRRLEPFSHDSARLATDPSLPDTTVRFLPGETLAPVCVRRIREDFGGFARFPTVLLVRDTSNVYLRDLHARDTLMFRPPFHRAFWMLTEGSGVSAGLRLSPVATDSMVGEWKLDQPP
jgi:hypothetical protein